MGIFSLFILLFLSFFCLRLFKGKVRISQRDLFIGWGIKLVFAFSFVFIFTHIYGNGMLYGDAFNFINDSRILNLYAYENPFEYIKLLFGVANENALFSQSILAETNIWSYGENGDFINDNRLIIRLNSVVHFVSFGNICVHVVFMAFLSYLGLILLTQTFGNYVKNNRLFFFTLVAFPSVGFWGSGITKEALLIFSLGLFFFGLFRLIRRLSVPDLFCLLTGGFMLLFNKPHVGLVILSLAPFLVIGYKVSWKKPVRLWFPFVVLTGLVVMTYTPGKINLLEKVSYKQRDLINMGKGGIFFVSDSAFCAFDYQHLEHFEPLENRQLKVLRKTSGEYKLFGQQLFHPFEISPSDKHYDVYLIQPPSASYIDVTPIHYNRWNMVKIIPEVLLNTLIRPFPWDPGSSLKFFSLGNNLIFTGLICFAFFNRRKNLPEEQYLLTYFIVASIVLLLIIGWTTPILGAIARYKTAAELCLLIALSISLKPLKHA